MTALLHSLAKTSAEVVLVRSGAAAIARAARRPRIILAYHNVLPIGAVARGERSLHMSAESFALQMESLAETHHVVPLEELLRDRGNGSRPKAAITFDDAYRGTIISGLKILKERGLPATIFVAPGLLGEAGCWWDVLAERFGGTMPDEVRRHAMERMTGCAQTVMSWASESQRYTATMADYSCPASEDELREAAGQEGITFGSHSWSHRNLARLPDHDLRGELERPLSWLRNRFPNSMPFLSYPYGRTSHRVAMAAKAAGYEGALRVQGGRVHRGPLDMFALPRMNVPAGLSLHGFRIRTSGLLAFG